MIPSHYRPTYFLVFSILLSEPTLHPVAQDRSRGVILNSLFSLVSYGALPLRFAFQNAFLCLGCGPYLAFLPHCGSLWPDPFTAQQPECSF